MMTTSRTGNSTGSTSCRPIVSTISSRFLSGQTRGETKLGKSDLLFSLLIASWEDATAMESLLEVLNQGGFEYDRDFILKSCLTVLGEGTATK